MTPTKPATHVCKIINSRFDSAGLPVLVVDCPNRTDMPSFETCLECGAFVMLASTLGGAAADVVCTPSTVRAKVRQDQGLPAEPASAQNATAKDHEKVS